MLGATGALLFCLVHFYWAAGGRIGVSPDAAPTSDRLWFWLYDDEIGADRTKKSLTG
ncbi:hypothetical protein GCM10009872_26950 [Actinopolymorpha rutila]